MLDQVLTRYQVKTGSRVMVRSVVAAAILALAVGLPQLAHLAVGASAGVTWLPMYLPVVLGGCILGVRFSWCVGLLSPLVSFWLTTAFASEPMPAAARLPFMMAELCVFAVVSGCFGKKIAENALWSVPAVIASFLCGRAVFLGLVWAMQGHTVLKTAMVWNQIKSGMLGFAAQLIVVPVVCALVDHFLLKEKKEA